MELGDKTVRLRDVYLDGIGFGSHICIASQMAQTQFLLKLLYMRSRMKSRHAQYDDTVAMKAT